MAAAANRATMTGSAGSNRHGAGHARGGLEGHRHEIPDLVDDAGDEDDGRQDVPPGRAAPQQDRGRGVDRDEQGQVERDAQVHDGVGLDQRTAGGYLPGRGEPCRRGDPHSAESESEREQGEHAGDQAGVVLGRSRSATVCTSSEASASTRAKIAAENVATCARNRSLKAVPKT